MKNNSFDLPTLHYSTFDVTTSLNINILKIQFGAKFTKYFRKIAVQVIRKPRTILFRKARLGTPLLYESVI